MLVKSLICSFLLSSCINTDPKNNLVTEKFYKRDMIITVNGITGEGVLVVPFSPIYRFEVEARGPLDMFIMSTCHREVSKEKAYNVEKTVKSGPFGWGTRKIVYKNKVTFDYIPDSEEIMRYCPMQLAGYDRDHGKHSWGFIDFIGGEERLKGSLSCNGEVSNVDSVSVCQARSGLIQSISFEKPIQGVESEPGCDKGEIDENTFRYTSSLGQCVYAILSANDIHRHTAIGYEGILLRDQ